MLELSCKAFAPPAPRLSLVQEAVRDTMRRRFPGAHLGVKSWPSLLQRHEQAAEAAEQWEPPAAPDSEDQVEEMCEVLCDKLKDEGCLQEQRAAMCRLMVAKLYQAMIKGIASHINSSWLAWFSELPRYPDSMVAAGAPHALVKVLRSDMHSAKADAAMTLRNIATEEQHVGAVVAAGAIEACVAVLQTGPDDIKENAACTLLNIATEEHVGALVAAAGAMGACVAVLQTGPDEAKENAACTLLNIATEEQHVGALVAAGAMEACVAVLQTGPDEAKENTARTLANIADHEQHVDAVVAAGVVEACVTVLQTGPDNAKSDAMCVLPHISYPEQHAGAVAAAGAITAILDTMHSMNSDDKYHAALLLAIFSDRLNATVVANMVAALVQESNVDPNEEDVFNIACALPRVLRHLQHVDAVVVGGTVAALTRVLQYTGLSASRMRQQVC